MHQKQPPAKVAFSNFLFSLVIGTLLDGVSAFEQPEERITIIARSNIFMKKQYRKIEPCQDPSFQIVYCIQFSLTSIITIHIMEQCN